MKIQTSYIIDIYKLILSLYRKAGAPNNTQNTDEEHKYYPTFRFLINVL